MKPLKQLNKAARNAWASHISTFQGRKMLPGRLDPSFAGMHHFAHLAPPPFCELGCRMENWQSSRRHLNARRLKKGRRRPRHTLYVQNDNETSVSGHVLLYVTIQVTQFFVYPLFFGKKMVLLDVPLARTLHCDESTWPWGSEAQFRAWAKWKKHPLL